MSRTPNRHLERLLQAADWTPTQLARAVRGVAGEHGIRLACDYTTVRRWLDGTQPRPPAPGLLLECLSRRLGRRLTAQDAGLTRAPVLVVDLSWEADPVYQLARLARAELDPVHRAVLGSTPFALSVLALPVWPSGHGSSRRHSSPATSPGRPGRSEVAHLHTMATAFASAAEQHGGRHVRAALAACLAHDVAPRLHAPARDQVHRDLLSASAQLTLLLGNMCADDGHDGLAQRYYQVAVELAAEADDAALLAIGLRTTATHAHELGHHTPAVLHLAEQAATYARRAPSITQAYVQAHLAVMQAHHDKRAALRALARAEHLHALADTAPGPFSSYPLGALHYQRAQVLAPLGDIQGAVHALTASLHARAPAEHRAAVLTRARLAEAHLRLGHLEQALIHWRAFLDTYPTLDSNRATRRLTVMREQLRPHARHSAAAGLLRRAADLA